MTQSSLTKRAQEAGFTLIETLTAIVILVFGLIAVTNLLIVAGTSNQVGSVATAATAEARRQMEALKSLPFTNAGMNPGGSIDSDVTGFNDTTPTIPGVGAIHTRWAISTIAGDNQIRVIQVRSESTTPLLRARSRADLMTFRACTDTTLGCPTP